MTRDEWLRVKRITAAALEQPEPARVAYVTSECHGDERLEHEVLSLLRSSAHAASLFETPVFTTPVAAAALANATLPPSSRVGARIGAYRIVREIGRGGMGTVFLAERADEEYQQRVALKIVSEPRSPETFKWFRDERQILATLDHPNIARLMDGGTTEDGLPYLVMEYVEGVPVDEYCDRNGLTVAQRLEIFRTICLAVDVAHRNLVVHRDLKPRNILVCDGVPKLLDFGIAKLLDSSASASVRPDSAAGPSLLTPEYASPEQVKGERITTATDVYALGVLLYRLLTGQSPYGVLSDAPHELATAICDQKPQRPSAAAPTAQLRRRLSGDLDAIVLKALEKDPAARYSSAGPLADDVSRHLAGLPLAARDAGLLYRAGKFVSRHKVGVTAVALVLVSLVGGLATALWQARETERQRERAQRHFDDVRRLASSLVFEVQDSIENVPGALLTRQLLVKRALEYFDGLAGEEQDDVELQREMAQAYDKLGNVLGRAYASNLGDVDAARASYEKALGIRERLAGAAPSDTRLQLDLWSSYYNVGGLLRETADTAGALKLHQNARAVLDAPLRAAPNDEMLLRSTAQTASTLSLSHVQAGHLREALAAADEALRIDEQLLARAPANKPLQNEVATAHGRIGQILMKTGDQAAARIHFQRAFDLATALVAAEPSNNAFRRRLSNTHSHFSQLFVRQGDLQAAWPHQQAALALRQALVDQNPADRQASIDLMVAELETGEVLARRSAFEAAAEHYRLALARAEPLMTAEPSYVYYRLTVATVLTRLTQASMERGQAREAAPLAPRAIDLMEAATAKDPADARIRFELAMAYSTMGDIVSGRGASGVVLTSADRGDSARSWYQRSLDVLHELAASGRRAGTLLDEDESDLIAALERKLSVTP